MTISRRLLIALLPLAMAVGCGVNIFPVSQDKQLGAEIDQEIKTNKKEYPLLQNDQVRSYVQGIVDNLIRSPAIEYRDQFVYDVKIINDDKTVNAFCTPGGYIYVYTGLLRFVESEAELAGILAHEIAHAEERHGTEHMTQAIGLSAILAAVNGSTDSEVTKIAASSASLLATLANSRSDEIEADTRGFTYMESTKWWPGAITLFFERMMTEQGRGTSIFEQWLSTHPAPEDRAENIRTLMKERSTPPQSPDNMMTASYRSMLRGLR